MSKRTKRTTGTATKATSTPQAATAASERRPPLRLEYRRAGDLTPNPANWRTHPPEQVEAVRAVINDVGYAGAALFNERTGRLIDGHLRRDLDPEADIPVLIGSWTDEEERKILATLDPTAGLAGMNAEAFRRLVDGMAFDSDAVKKMLAGLDKEAGRLIAVAAHERLIQDETPEPPKKPVTKPGDLWLLGEHRVLCGDCLNPEDVNRALGGAEPVLLDTDPPYGVSYDPSWRDGIYNAMGPAEGAYMRTEGHRNTTLSGDTKIDWSDAFALVPSLRVGYVWHAGVHAHHVAAGLIRIGFQIVSQIIWDKGLFAMGRSWYHWMHEPCWVVRKPDAPVPFFGERNQSTIWRAPSPKMIMSGSKEEKFDHPAQKPVVLMATPILNHTRDGDSVYEPFLGSGTTLVAAEQIARRCVGIEIDPKYVDVCVARWEALTGRKAERKRA